MFKRISPYAISLYAVIFSAYVFADDHLDQPSAQEVEQNNIDVTIDQMDEAMLHNAQVIES